MERDIERDMPECEKWNMEDEFKEMHAVGDELADAIDELHAINERNAKYLWDAQHGL